MERIMNAGINARLGISLSSDGSRLSPRDRQLRGMEGGVENQPTIWPIFHENCMKMKKFRATGARASMVPPPPPPKIRWCWELGFSRNLHIDQW